MGGERQQPLPGFEEYLGQENVPLRFPQPRIEGYKPPNWYDIFYHPLDINFKGRLRAWLEHLQRSEGFAMEEILPETYLKLVRLYLFDDSWPNKGKVMAQVNGDPDVDLKQPLVKALVRVWRRAKNGPRAIEILKIAPRDNFIYESIVSHKIKEGEGYRRLKTIDELATCPADDLRKICGARAMFNKLKKYMQHYFSDWNPELVFREELPPEKAFDY